MSGQPSLRFVVTSFAIIVISALAITANWGSGFDLLAFARESSSRNANLTTQAEQPADILSPGTGAAEINATARAFFATTRYVDNTPGGAGTDFTSTGGTQPAVVPGLTPGVTIFPTIQAAVAAASSGDTINVADG